MPDHDLIRHELSCRGQPLIGVAVVIDEVDTDRLAQDSAGRVQLSHRQLDAVLHLLGASSISPVSGFAKPMSTSAARW